MFRNLFNSAYKGIKNRSTLKRKEEKQLKIWGTYLSRMIYNPINWDPLFSSLELFRTLTTSFTRHTLTFTQHFASVCLPNLSNSPNSSPADCFPGPYDPTKTTYPVEWANVPDVPRQSPITMTQAMNSLLPRLLIHLHTASGLPKHNIFVCIRILL